MVPHHPRDIPLAVHSCKVERFPPYTTRNDDIPCWDVDVFFCFRTFKVVGMLGFGDQIIPLRMKSHNTGD